MTDVFLIQPPIHDFYLTAKRTMPYGLASMAAALLADGLTVAVFDALATDKARPIAWPADMEHLRPYYGNPDRSPFALFHQFRHFGYSFDHIGRQARASGAYLVGISALFTPYLDQALQTADAVKAWHPGCKIVMGGHHPTAFPEEVLRHPSVDYVIRGEGEIALPMLARAMQDGYRRLSSVPGLAYQRADGVLQVNPPTIVQDLERMALPAMHLLQRKYYRRRGKGSVVIVASRGCPLACSYCCVGSSSYLGYRRRPVAGVMQEIEAAAKAMPLGFIDFEDETLALDRDWFLELLQSIRTRFADQGPELRAMNGLFPPSLDDTVVKAMAVAGFKTINLSLGTTSLPQLKRFRRPDIRGAFDRALTLAAKYDLEAVGYIIAGGPEQPARSSLEDLIFLARRNVLAGVSIFYPAPGSYDYEWCTSQGLLPQTYGQMRASALPLSHPTSRVEGVTLLRLGRIVNFMKQLVGQGEVLPHGCPPAAGITATEDRTAVGRTLLNWFLYDGQIRGVDQDGNVYEHRSATHLTKAFRESLKRITIAPVGRSGRRAGE